MLHWLIHILGLDTQNDMPYMFWSGVGPVLFTQGSLFLVYYLHHKCHQTWCPWLGHPDPVHHRPICKKHYEKGARKNES
jgi:hypothetical protein